MLIVFWKEKKIDIQKVIKATGTNCLMMERVPQLSFPKNIYPL